MGYGIRIREPGGSSTILTPAIASIIDSDRLTMPNSLNGDDTYGTDVNLPVANVSVNDIGVIAYPVQVHFQATVIPWYWSADGSFPFTWYAKDDATYYTKDSEGVMTAWTAGSLTMDDSNSYDGMCAAFPIAGWDYTDSTTTVSAVRIWAAMAHIVFDASASAFKTVYTIGDEGVETVDYMIFLKNHEI